MLRITLSKNYLVMTVTESILRSRRLSRVPNGNPSFSGGGLQRPTLDGKPALGRHDSIILLLPLPLCMAYLLSPNFG